MGNGTKTTGTTTSPLSTFEEFLVTLPKDDSNVIERLSKVVQDDERPIEIISELPERFIPDILLATVNRWRDVSKYFNKPIRVYGWCYDDAVEKYIQQMVCARDGVQLTVLPHYLKEVVDYA